MSGGVLQVHTGSRLHFGLILGDVATGWVFGGVGLMLQQPGWELQLEPIVAAGGAPESQSDLVTGSPTAVGRVAALLYRLRVDLPELPILRVCIGAEVPFHTGLGAGTQLALGIAAACRWLCRQQPHQTPLQLAAAAGRAERSAIGTWGFDHGGFLVDYGAASAGDAGRVRSLVLPDEWRFVLVRPREAEGLSGVAESAWFGTRPRMSASLVGEMAAIITDCLVPAIEGNQFCAFARALQDYGNAAGKFYAGQQGHVFAAPEIRRLVEHLLSAGIQGAAQSSWGPGIGIPAVSQEEAERIAGVIGRFDCGGQLLCSITSPMNCGASISRPAPEIRSDTRIV